MAHRGDGSTRAGRARTALAVAVLVVGVTGLLTATEGASRPLLPTGESGITGAVVALTPVAAGCAPTGPYRPPAPGSVGLPPGTDVCTSGPITVTTPGAVLDGWDVRGGVEVAARDVVIRRSRITGDGTTAYGVWTGPGGSVRIEDTTVTGTFTAAALGGDRVSAERLDIVDVHGSGAVLGDDTTLRASHVHGLAPLGGPAGGTGDHADDGDDAGGDDAGRGDGAGVVVRGTRDVVVEDNRIEVGDQVGSALLLDPRPDPTVAARRDDTSGVVVRGNLLGGGGVTLRQVGDGGTEVWLTANRFHRDAAAAPMWVGRTVVREDNLYVDGGRLPDR